MRYFGDGKLAELDSVGASHRYLVDPTASGNRFLAELDATGGMQTAYVYGPRGLISQISGGQTYTFFHNLQGSTVALVDSTGVLKNSYRYDSFGQKLTSSMEQVANSFTFLGSFSVLSTGQYSLMTYRVYDSKYARFTAVDPLRYQAFVGISPYLYGKQSPGSRVDPSGLLDEAASDALGQLGYDNLALAGTYALSYGAGYLAGLGVPFAATVAVGAGAAAPFVAAAALSFTTGYALGDLAYEYVPGVQPAASAAVATFSVPSAGETILPNGDCYVGTVSCGNINFEKGPPAATSTQGSGTATPGAQSSLPIQPRGGK